MKKLVAICMLLLACSNEHSSSDEVYVTVDEPTDQELNARIVGSYCEEDGTKWLFTSRNLATLWTGNSTYTLSTNVVNGELSMAPIKMCNSQGCRALNAERNNYKLLIFDDFIVVGERTLYRTCA